MNGKEAVRRLISARPVEQLVRTVTSQQRLPRHLRQRVYFTVAKKMIQRPGDVFEHQPRGGATIRIHRHGTVRTLYWLGEYEPEALPLFAEYARRSNGILDIGAAEGIYSLFAASVSPSARIVAFEPGQAQGERLRANLAINPALAERITHVDSALSSQVGTAQFFELPGGTSSLNAEFRSNSVPRTVPVATGDGVLAELDVPMTVDLIKVDTESTEPDVLAGLETTITATRPVIFCEVLAGRTEQQLQELTDRWGYSTWWLGPDGPESRSAIVGVSGWMNWLFVPDGEPPLTVG